VPVNAEAKRAVLDFLAGRLRAWVEEGDWPRDVLAAVLAEQAANPTRALAGIEQLSHWVRRDDWESILDNFARCVRITRGETTQYTIDPDLLAEPQERALYEAYQTAAAQIDEASNVDGFLSAFAPMVPAVAAFFDNVLVNAEDEAIRGNRLGLLQAIGSFQRGRADLSQLSGF
jgi:glycyl-tRNA synthetase beta subunit